MKLFEIPIYAMGKSQLTRKYHQCASQIREELSGHPEKQIQSSIATRLSPPCRWEYNHIVGYIVISVMGQDVELHVYLPTPHKKRYVWLSGRKIFLYDICANGTHFYISDNMGNGDIQKRTAEMLNEVIKTHIPKRYFVDKECFETLNGMVDYRTIVEDNYSQHG